jgi:hypothetical protein
VPAVGFLKWPAEDDPMILAGPPSRRSVKRTVYGRPGNYAGRLASGGIATQFHALALILTSGIGVPGRGPAARKRHEYRGDVDHSAPPDAKADWRSMIRSLSCIRCRCRAWRSSSLLRTAVMSGCRFSTDEKGTGLRVGMRSGGKKASAKVTWVIHDLHGRTLHGRIDVVFE